MSAKSVYDFLVIGGGSGGMASARRAASHGAKVALIEQSRLGGTCVNVGCVPKKLFYNAAFIKETIGQAKSYCFENDFNDLKFNWKKFKNKRDEYITKLNNIYCKNLDKDNVTLYRGTASFENEKRISVDTNGKAETIEAKHILIAVGGEPVMPKIEGIEHAITSDGFFELQEQPKRVAVVGSGYIALELAGVFNTLGSKVHLFTRTNRILRAFDELISSSVEEEMNKHGVKFHHETNTTKIQKEKDGLKLTYLDKKTNKELEIMVDCVLIAVGRTPSLESIQLKNTGVKLDEQGFIKVDEYQQTTVEKIYAVGDIIGKYQLTPVAIAAGRRLSDRLFGGPSFKKSKLEYSNIPTVTFTHPPTGSIGLTENEAIEKFGKPNLKIYNSSFVNLYYSMMENQEMKQKTIVKLICQGKDEKVVGLHLVGRDVDEMLQGFGVAVKMGATKKDFDSCVAIHPTGAEEIVTLK